jgi:methyl-accepting chemotaxis protein
MVSQIAEANMKQAISSKDIAQNIEGISNVAHETATGVSQIARTAEDLDRLTLNLQQLTNTFKLSSQRRDKGYHQDAPDVIPSSSRSIRMLKKEP